MCGILKRTIGSGGGENIFELLKKVLLSFGEHTTIEPATAGGGFGQAIRGKRRHRGGSGPGRRKECV